MVSRLTNSYRLADSQKGLLDRVADERLGLRSVQLRFLGESGAFDYQTQCPIGWITIPEIPSRKGNAELNFDIRFAGLPLHQSEILIVDPSWELVGAENVSQVLLRAGIEVVNIRTVAEKLGLVDKLSLSPLKLAEPDARILGMAASACTKFRVIIFENAFKGIPPQRVESVAAFLLERVKKSSQVYILLGDEGVPESWQSKYGVKFSVDEDGGHKTHGALRKVRKLVASSRVDQLSDQLVTRPQRLPQSENRKEKAANSELISNPNHDLELSYRPQPPGKISKIRLRNSLTRVSIWDRLRYQFDNGFAVRRIKAKLGEMIEDKTPLGALMPEVKLQMMLARKRVNFLECLLLATSLMFIVLYLVRK